MDTSVCLFLVQSKGSDKTQVLILEEFTTHTLTETNKARTFPQTTGLTQGAGEL